MKKVLFWLVTILWAGLIVAVYTTGATNSFPFHNESLITYTTSGMTNEQAANFCKYIISLGKNSNGDYNYDIPTFTIDLNSSPMLNLDNGNNTYTVLLMIPNYQQYGLSIKSRGQSEGIMILWGIIGAVLIVFGGIIGMAITLKIRG
jgi:hypothetical protein